MAAGNAVEESPDRHMKQPTWTMQTITDLAHLLRPTPDQLQTPVIEQRTEAIQHRACLRAEQDVGGPSMLPGMLRHCHQLPSQIRLLHPDETCRRVTASTLLRRRILSIKPRNDCPSTWASSTTSSTSFGRSRWMIKSSYWKSLKRLSAELANRGIKLWMSCGCSRPLLRSLAH